jgi:HAD superfamily hydrolase (TIGR01450 family)
MDSGQVIRDKSLFFLDLDGVLRVGKDETKLIGGVMLISKLNSTGRDFRILSNTTTATAPELSLALKKIGLEISPEKIFTASNLTGKYLKDRFGRCVCFLIGEKGFAEELRQQGHEVVSLSEEDVNRNKSNENSFVVVGLDRRLTFAELNRAMIQVRKGARIVASHTARQYFDASGPTISVGPIVAALEYATKQKPMAVIGKPSPLMYEIALSQSDKKASDAVMIGDQIEIDIVGARSLGIFGVLVLTGVDTRDSAKESAVKPDLIVDNVDDIAELL